jgi:hypothetical protein
MLAMNMATVQIVNMIAMQDRCVPTPRTVRVTVWLGLCVLRRRHGASLSG